jgi:hypothetical protein
MPELSQIPVGTQITLTATVIEDRLTDGDHWGPNHKLGLRIDSGLDGVKYADVRATVSNAGPWFTKAMHKAEAKLNAPASAPEPAPEGEPQPEIPDANQVKNMTVKQLRAAGEQFEIELPEKAGKPELTAAILDGLSARQAA